MDIVSFQSFVLESLGGCISSNTKIVSPCSYLGFLQDEQNLSRDQKNGPVDSEEIEMDELYFDRDKQSLAKGKERNRKFAETVNEGGGSNARKT